MVDPGLSSLVLFHNVKMRRGHGAEMGYASGTIWSHPNVPLEPLASNPQRLKMGLLIGWFVSNKPKEAMCYGYCTMAKG